LANRYMSELGTNVGVFVVVWMGMPRCPAKYRPLWASPAAAREELEQLAREVETTSEGCQVWPVVIDASLPTSPQRPQSRKRVTSRTPPPPPRRKTKLSRGERRKAATDKKPTKPTRTKKKPGSKRREKKVATAKKTRVKSPDRNKRAG
jgi:hypothetical protein